MSNDERNSGLLSPEVRTQQFFDQQFPDLAEALVGMTIAVPGTQNRIVVTATEGYEKATNLKQPYKQVLEMEHGTLAAIDYPFRKAVLPLIAAREGEGKGACVRIMGATTNELGKVKPLKKGADILDALMVETGGAAKLAFLDPSNILYVLKGLEGSEAAGSPETIISAGDELERAFDEIGK